MLCEKYPHKYYVSSLQTHSSTSKLSLPYLFPFHSLLACKKLRKNANTFKMVKEVKTRPINFATNIPLSGGGVRNTIAPFGRNHFCHFCSFNSILSLIFRSFFIWVYGMCIIVEGHNTQRYKSA